MNHLVHRVVDATSMMNSSASTSKKRKADEISDGQSVAVDMPAHLPPPVWGGILDFLPYAEVRSALLVSKLVANDATKYVQTLNIFKAHEMYVPATRRFTNITRINILALLVGTGEINEHGFELYSFSPDAAGRTVVFLTSFAKLEGFFLGGFLPVEGLGGIRKFHYFSEDGGRDDSTFEAEEYMRSLILSICGAFKTGLLPQTVNVEGLFEERCLQWVRPCTDMFRRDPDEPCRRDYPGNPCHFCRDVCKSFPLGTLLRKDVVEDMQHGSGVGNYSCLQKTEYFKLLSQRLDGREKLAEISEEFLCSWLNFHLNCFDLKDVIDDSPKPFTKRLLEIYQVKHLKVHSLKLFFDFLDEYIEAGIDPKRISGKTFFDRLSSHIGKSGDLLHVWKRSTVEKLAARGFPVYYDHIAVINDEEVHTHSDSESSDDEE